MADGACGGNGTRKKWGVEGLPSALSRTNQSTDGAVDGWYMSVERAVAGQIPALPLIGHRCSGMAGQKARSVAVGSALGEGTLIGTGHTALARCHVSPPPEDPRQA